jgi:hypothetical protein
MQAAVVSALPVASSAIVAITRRSLKLSCPTNLEVMTIFKPSHLSYGNTGKRLPVAVIISLE